MTEKPIIRSDVRFGVVADQHLMGPDSMLDEHDCTAHLQRFEAFLEEMREWQPDFIIDLGDFACQASNEPTSRASHDAQLAGLRKHWASFQGLGVPVYLAMGNHDVGWVRGGDEEIEPDALWTSEHFGEDITKAEWVEATGLPGRYYAVDAGPCRLIALDTYNHAMTNGSPTGPALFDEGQLAWLDSELAAHPHKPTFIACHQEVHYTPIHRGPNGEDLTFEHAPDLMAPYIANRAEVDAILARHPQVIASFTGHSHISRLTVHEGVYHFIVAGAFATGAFAKVTVCDRLVIEGARDQSSYDLPLLADWARR